MNSNGRWPQNIKIWISQQWLMGSSPNFKHKLMGPNQIKKRFQWRQRSMKDDLQWKMTFNERWPPMEDDLKIWKFWYRSSLNFKLRLGDQIKIRNAWNEDDLQWKTTSNARWPPMEDDVFSYLSNHWSDLPQVLNLVGFSEILNWSSED